MTTPIGPGQFDPAGPPAQLPGPQPASPEQSPTGEQSAPQPGEQPAQLPGNPPSLNYRRPDWSPYLGWGRQQEWAQKPRTGNRHGCLISILAVLLLALVGSGLLVASCVQTMGPALKAATDIKANSGGRVVSISYNWNNGSGSFTIMAAKDIDEAGAKSIACDVVRPRLKGTSLEGTPFAIYAWTGFELASDKTPCP